MNRIGISLLTSFVVAFALTLSPEATKAATVFTVSQVGADVQIVAAGSYNLTGATYVGSAATGGFMNSSLGLAVGPFAGVDGYSLTLNPGAFGTGGFVGGSLVSGDTFGLDVVNLGGYITVPAGYTSGPLAGTATFLGQSFASLGLTPGTFVYGIPNDTLTVNVLPIPEPGSLTGLALAALALRRRRLPCLP